MAARALRSIQRVAPRASAIGQLSSACVASPLTKRLVGRVTMRRFAIDATDSHSDFAPKSKVAPEDDLKAQLAKLVKAHKVVLFMKGTPEEPRCGFSARVVKLLHMNGAEIHGVDVLSSPELRATLKDFSSWPTFPQLYIDGEFIGGCDIATQLHEQGELAKLLK